jgi:hypothetical protein
MSHNWKVLKGFQNVWETKRSSFVERPEEGIIMLLMITLNESNYSSMVIIGDEHIQRKMCKSH